MCEFPSKYFYKGKLETAHSVLNRTPVDVTWPNGDRYPFAFHHVEGTEETLVVTTDRGNENSKKNQEEIEKVVSDVLYIEPRMSSSELCLSGVRT